MDDKHIVITKGCVKPLLETGYVNVYDLQYAPGRHYYDATRRKAADLAAVKSDEEFRAMLADAVTIFAIIKPRGEEPRLLLQYEYRYPVGRFLLSPPAGLVDDEDKGSEDALIVTAKRELMEECGIELQGSDRCFVVSPLLFSTPGMTDESNATVCAVVNTDSLNVVSNDGAVGTELFAGAELLTKSEALKLLQDSKDRFGNFFSIFTWAALSYFVSGAWERE